MKIQLKNTDLRNNLTVLHPKPLTEYSADEIKALKEKTTYVSIYVKDANRVNDAKSILNEKFSHFKGLITEKETSTGSYHIGRSINEERNDATPDVLQIGRAHV